MSVVSYIGQKLAMTAAPQSGFGIACAPDVSEARKQILKGYTKSRLNPPRWRATHQAKKGTMESLRCDATTDQRF
jgi:hypothetical protein